MAETKRRTAAELYADEEWTRREQRTLGLTSWQFVATTDSFPEIDSWVRVRAFGEEVFVQVTGSGYRAFRNVCPHRGFPLRRAECGAGRIECGFHGWVFDDEGAPLGIPRNHELFRLTAEEKRERRLDPVRVELVGRFVFVAISPGAPPLAEYLGRYAGVLASVSAGISTPTQSRTVEVAANWKLYLEITLDDYHLDSVHPKTFADRQLRAKGHFFYSRDRRHSSMFVRKDLDWSFDGFDAACEAGRYDFSGYKIHQIFPSLFFVTTRELTSVFRVESLGAASTRISSWFYVREGADDSARDAILDYYGTVEQEDVVAVESHQTSITAFRKPPLHGDLETRIAWFHEALSEALVGID